MTTKSADSSAQALQGESCPVQLQSPQPGLHEHQVSRARNQVFKSGYLFLSSKGIGWTSWKKRWFILTRTSLVFFRSDPSAAPQKGAEVNLTLGGIDLNNSGSVEVKADKKLLTVFFPDGRDGRAFTLKAETLDDLYEWKTALESALAQAPSATVVTGQNGILKSEQADAVNGSSDQQKDRQPVKSMVIGRPILLALEDIDGSPSFLEKALRFIEDHGIRVEGILRQAADVEEVHRRVREYERGKTEFSPEEDAHVIADCVKYVLRELPSSPVPASCCNALLEAFRTDRNNRLNAMRAAILDTFPEPNRKLLQRMLLMMQTVASNKAVNRMSTSAVAACMAPLLLRPLLAGDCVLENTHMDVAGDGSFQLLQAAAAANHAQAIIITLLDEYENIFGEGSVSPDLFSDSDESGSQSEEATEDDDMYEDDDQDYESDEHASDDHGAETDNDYEHSVSETCSYSGDHGDSDSYDDKHSERRSSVSQSPERDDRSEAIQGPSSATSRALMAYHDNNVHKVNTTSKLKNENSVRKAEESNKPHRDVPAETSSVNHSATHGPSLGSQALSTKIAGSMQGVRHPRWGRTSARKNLSMESIDFSLEEEDEIRELEAAKNDLQNQIDEEVSGNAILHASLEQRKKALHERRLALEKDVARLQEQLQKERDLRAALESGLVSAQGPVAAGIDETTRIELEEIALAEENFNNVKQRLDDLGMQLNQQRELNAAVMFEKKNKQQEAPTRGMPLINKKDNNSRDSSQHLERSSSSEGQQTYFPDEADRDNEKQNESSYSSNKNQVQQSDSILNSNSRYGGVPSNPSSAEPAVSRPVSSSSSKKSRGEGSNSTTSALSKLTTRLNFLKERRTQIANELQNIDKTRVSPQPSPGKAKGSDSQQNANKDKNQASEGGSVQVQEDYVPQSSDRGVTTEGGSHSNQDGYKRGSSSKHDGASFQNPDKGRKPEVQSAQNFDRGKSEGHSSSRNNADKSRRSDNSARTSSR